MGQKVNPIGFRLGVSRTWNSRWYAERDYAKLLHEDLAIKRFLKQKLFQAQVAKIVIERAANKAKIYVHTAKPGMIIGKRSAQLDSLKAEVQKISQNEIFLNVIEVRKADMDAQLIAENVAAQLERRVSFRRAMKKSMQMALRAGAKGVKIHCSGRLGGAEMARSEFYREGRVPLHTLRADIDYGVAEGHTTYGSVGVKVWVYKGEVIPGQDDNG